MTILIDWDHCPGKGKTPAENNSSFICSTLNGAGDWFSYNSFYRYFVTNGTGDNVPVIISFFPSYSSLFKQHYSHIDSPLQSDYQII